MHDKNDWKIYTTVVLGLLLFVGTFMVVWDATEAYRENIKRPMENAAAASSGSGK